MVKKKSEFVQYLYMTNVWVINNFSNNINKLLTIVLTTY